MTEKQDYSKLTIGERLKLARSRAHGDDGKGKLTAEKVAEILGVSPQTVSNWERDITPPRKSTAFKLYAEKSGFNVEYLMGITDYPTETEWEHIVKNVQKRNTIALEFINSIHEYKFGWIDDKTFEVLVYDYEKEPIVARKWEHGLTVTATTDDMYFIIDTVRNCAQAIVDSFVRNSLLPRAVEKATGEKKPNKDL